MPEIPPHKEPVTLPAALPTLAYVEPSAGVTASFAGRSLGGYELLEEIGRGGMGVVFKARQRALGRVVALKTILAGQLASADDVRRFRTEAEAAALLDHPNIVPIHEVGQDDGHHYFAIKLIEGSGLGQLIPGLLEDTTKVVRLLAKVARAVDHAHQRGILHRDLKPANVLVDSQGEPHVTDFGLAKRAGEVGQTQSGAIVGTPGYMSPEQARADKGLTTAADIYSLGAILYECLTGRPPFQAETALETILQVLEKEPDAPHSLNARVDPELEAVCLKCIAKDPQQRYKSAAALADDLDQWLTGGTVTARPPNALARMRQWLRRDFRAAAMTIFLGLVFGILWSVLQWPRIVGTATRARELYATSFPSETPPVMASWLSVKGMEAVTIDTEPIAEHLLPLLIFLLPLIFGGFLNALLLRPKTSAAALSAGLSTGLVAGIFALLFGVGWMALISSALGPMQSDLELLADGYRAESLQRQEIQAGRESAALRDWDHEVEKQRPDLLRAEVLPQDRARALAEKIKIDLRLNLQAALWKCLALLVGFILTPMVIQTTITQSLVARGDGRARLFVHYLELAVPGTLFSLLCFIVVINLVVNFGEPAVLRLFVLMGWAVLGGLMWDRVLRRQQTWRVILTGVWLLAGLALSASCLHLTFTPRRDWQFWMFICDVLGCAAMTAAAVYGVFFVRWRWYVRLASYLGIILALVALHYLMS